MNTIHRTDKQLNLMNMLNGKCRYHDKCHYYVEDGFTCNTDEEARDYCGAFRAHSRKESSEVEKPSRSISIGNLTDSLRSSNGPRHLIRVEEMN